MHNKSKLYLKAGNGCYVVISLKREWFNVVKREIPQLRSDWNGDLNYAYNKEEWKNLLLASKSLNGL